MLDEMDYMAVDQIREGLADARSELGALRAGRRGPGILLDIKDALSEMMLALDDLIERLGVVEPETEEDEPEPEE
jgi:hypothetical protein